MCDPATCVIQLPVCKQGMTNKLPPAVLPSYQYQPRERREELLQAHVRTSRQDSWGGEQAFPSLCSPAKLATSPLAGITGRNHWQSGQQLLQLHVHYMCNKIYWNCSSKVRLNTNTKGRRTSCLNMKCTAKNTNLSVTQHEAVPGGRIHYTAYSSAREQ